MIADSLPDKWGNSLLRHGCGIIIFHEANESGRPPFFIGSRAMGAIEYEPAQKIGDNAVFSVNVQKLYEFAKTSSKRAGSNRIESRKLHSLARIWSRSALAGWESDQRRLWL